MIFWPAISTAALIILGLACGKLIAKLLLKDLQTQDELTPEQYEAYWDRWR